VLIGLVPFFIRFLVFFILDGTNINYILNEVDMVTFGLVLNLTNINELESYQSKERMWKTTNIGISVLLLIIFAAFLMLVYLSEIQTNLNFNRNNIKYCALALGISSFFLSYSIYDKLNKELKSQ
jgi:O-antigen/teichoic acid export membrane protein